MNDLMHHEWWRYVNIFVSFGVICTLTFSAIVFRQARGMDYALRALGFVPVFAVSTYASQAALHRHLPPQDYNFYLSLALVFLWVVLLSPWHWRSHHLVRKIT